MAARCVCSLFQTFGATKPSTQSLISSVTMGLTTLLPETPQLPELCNAEFNIQLEWDDLQHATTASWPGRQATLANVCMMPEKLSCCVSRFVCGYAELEVDDLLSMDLRAHQDLSGFTKEVFEGKYEVAASTAALMQIDANLPNNFSFNGPPSCAT